MTQELACTACSTPVLWEYAHKIPVDVYVDEELGWLDIDDDKPDEAA